MKKYKFNRFEFIRKTQQIIFRFDKNLTFNQYLFKKTNLLRNANVNDETFLIHYLWKKLNVQLVLTTLIRENYNSINNFNKRTQINKIVIKKIHNLNKKAINATRSLINNQFIFNSTCSKKFVSTINKIQKFLNNY